MLELPNSNRMEFIALLCEGEGEKGSRERRGSSRAVTARQCPARCPTLL